MLNILWALGLYLVGAFFLFPPVENTNVLWRLAGSVCWAGASFLVLREFAEWRSLRRTNAALAKFMEHGDVPPPAGSKAAAALYALSKTPVDHADCSSGGG